MHMVDPFYVKTPITSVLYSHEKKIVVVCCFKNQSRKVLQSVHKMDDVTVGTDWHSPIGALWVTKLWLINSFCCIGYFGEVITDDFTYFAKFQYNYYVAKYLVNYRCNSMDYFLISGTCRIQPIHLGQEFGAILVNTFVWMVWMWLWKWCFTFLTKNSKRLVGNGAILVLWLWSKFTPSLPSFGVLAFS